MKLLITGATGFIGSRLCDHLDKRKIKYHRAVRKVDRQNDIEIGSINSTTDWSPALQKVDTVIHLASRAHVLNKTKKDKELYYETNVYGVTKLAKQCLQYNIQRFIYISSIGVNGCSTSGTPFNENDKPEPCEMYAVTKLEAEKELNRILKNKMILIIIRPPLVYGPGNPGNMRLLINLAKSRLPLPLKNIRNQKHFIFVENLISAILKSASTEKSNLFLIADNQSISTAELVVVIRKILNNSSKVFGVPFLFLRIIFGLIGQTKKLKKLNSEILIHNEKIKKELDWQPYYTLQEGLEITIKSEYLP